MQEPTPFPSHASVHEHRLTFAPYGHVLTNIGCWSPDGLWIVYDVRSDPAGSLFDGTRIERVHRRTKEVQVLYASRDGAYVGVVTHHPQRDRVVFIHGPENPTDDWRYAAYHRRGVMLDLKTEPGLNLTVNIDACCITEPYIDGALRGGSHVHTFDPSGKWISFTYEDHVLATGDPTHGMELNQRNVGVSVPLRAVDVRSDHPRNHSGSHFTVLVTTTKDHPEPGSDDISRAYEDAWIGTAGYRRSDGKHVARALAFLGDVRTPQGALSTELFIVDLSDDLTRPGLEGPLSGTRTTRPRPPSGITQRRVTFTGDGKHSGIQGPRHWPRSTPDGSQIAVLMKDARGVPQIHIVQTGNGMVRPLTNLREGIQSAFSISPNGRWIAHHAHDQVCVTHMESGRTWSLTARTPPRFAPRPEACVFDPTGKQIAYVRPVVLQGQEWNQVFCVEFEEESLLP